MTKSLWLVLLLGMGACVMAEEPARTITVNGTGIAEVAPDRASVQMSIEVRKPSLADAQKGAADVTDSVLKMLDRMGIDRDKVDTTGASVRPDYRWNNKTEEQELRGYISTRQISVEVEDLDNLGAVIEGAVGAGVNQVSPPQLFSSQRKAVYRRALRAAADDARKNAAELADALGTSLGKVVSIQAGSNQPPPIHYTANVRAMAASGDAAESYNPADLSFNATVTVIFELED